MEYPLIVLVPALPLLGALIVALFGWKLKEYSHWPIVLAIGASFFCSLAVLKHVSSGIETKSTSATTVGYEEVVSLWNWLNITDAYDSTQAANVIATETGKPLTSVPFNIDIVLRVDPLTAIMLCMVTFIATLVAIYASGYMHGDRSYWRFFSYIGLFVFSMTMLVSVSNFVLLFVFWEAVGACSYLLIGFWYQKPEAAAAGKKAFLVNRVGDFGFALALFLIWTNYGTLDYHDSQQVLLTSQSQEQQAAYHAAHPVAGVVGQTRLSDPTKYYVGGGIAVAICALLLVGCCGKSAQLPLHVWLPDAMEGPTPVSALIHAATMVTAGVYLVTRCTPLFIAAGAAPLFTVGGEAFTAQMLVSVVGGATALLAGLIAMTQTDLKRVLAYSTVSQLGYMFISLGTGSPLGIVAGMFHLFTHAFFKALLFLGSGSVMHAMGHIIDMRHFSGLRKIMPITHITFLIGCLALAGIVPFAGFWSKDEILAALHERAHPTATEHAATHAAVDQAPNLHLPVALKSETSTNKEPAHEHKATLSEAAYQSTLSRRLYGFLYYLALGCAGLTAFYTFRAFYMTFYGELKVPAAAGDHAHESPPVMTMPLVILALCSIFVGMIFGPSHSFLKTISQTPSLAYIGLDATNFHPVFHYDIALWGTAVGLIGIGLASYLYLGNRVEVNALTKMMGPLYNLSYGKFFVDQAYLVLFVFPMTVIAYLCYAFDRWIVDGIVNLCGAIPSWTGRSMRLLQNGMVQFYALAMILGLVVLVWGMVLYAR